jgi:hypothetical protein
MNLPVLFTIVIIFIIWLNYEIRKTSKRSTKDTDKFWDREKESNSRRRADISDLKYIIISTDQLPMSDNTDDTINSYRDTIIKLSGKKAINLSDITNTDLKLTYGVANINLLSEYDYTYTILVSILQKWAERLYEQGNRKDCISVLEYAITCYTDVTKSYKLLAELYVLENTADRIDELINLLPKTKIVDKDKLIEELTIIKNSSL